MMKTWDEYSGQKKYWWAGHIFGYEVEQGRRAVDPEDNPKKLPLVPKKYREITKEYLDWRNQCKAEKLAALAKAEEERANKPKIEPIPVEVINLDDLNKKTAPAPAEEHKEDTPSESTTEAKEGENTTPEATANP